MLTWLTDLLARFGRLQSVPLPHVPHARRGDDRIAPGVLLRPDDHFGAAPQAGQGPADPRRWARLASADEEGHADDGRADDPVRPLRLVAAVGESGEPLCLDRAVRHRRLRRDRLLRRLSQGDEAIASRLFRPRAARRRIPHRADRVLRDDAHRRGRRDFARGAVLQRLCRRSRLGVSAVRPVRHRRLRQRGQSDRRARRAGDRAGDDRRGDPGADRLFRRQSALFAISADQSHSLRRRSHGHLRRADRRRRRLSLVQRAAGADLHGRHRFAGARRTAGRDGGRDQARIRARDHRRPVRDGGAVGRRAGRLVQADGQARLSHGADSSSFRAARLVRAADRHALLDRRLRAGDGRPRRP